MSVDIELDLCSFFLFKVLFTRDLLKWMFENYIFNFIGSEIILSLKPNIF